MEKSLVTTKWASDGMFGRRMLQRLPGEGWPVMAMSHEHNIVWVEVLYLTGVVTNG